MNYKFKTVFMIALLALGVLFLGACTTGSQGGIPEDFQVTIEKSACHGTCPVYTLTVSADGTVTYNGLEHVAVSGEQTATLPESAVIELFDAVQAAEFFSLDEEYTIPATDLPSATTTVTLNGETTAVYHYGLGCGSEADNAPTALCDLEAMLEGIAVANGWIV